MNLFGFQIRYRKDKGAIAGTTRSVLFGRGAGYIGGATLFFARNCARPENRYVPVPFQFGITRNANAVPYTRH